MSRGQTILEFIFLMGIAVLVLFFMGPGIKRGVQSLVKASADQIGNQANSDQLVVRSSNVERPLEIQKDWDGKTRGDGGYLIGSNSSMSSTASNTRTERLYVSNVDFHEQTNMTTSSKTDLGFTPD